MKRVNKLVTGIFLLGQTLSGAAFAASMTLPGVTIDFTFDDAMLGLFGQASVSGNTLYFTPTGFQAKSLNSAGYALTNDTINVKVSAHAGWGLTGVELTEKGDYLLLGAGSTADVAGQMRVFDLGHPLADVVTGIQPTMPLNIMSAPTHNWLAETSTDLSAWGHTQSINVTIENLLLSSTSAASSLAFVEKKFVGLTPILTTITPVPEADTYAMMLAGLGLVGWSAARRRTITM
ncbi:MAG: PEP-CTERM sorting domain-containing protein [Thiobacillaceae bacterium]